jgi:N6-adenosine-specific RNA methylase IME4
VIRRVDGITEHPEAALVPEMRPDEYANLLADVRVRGVVVPLEVLGDVVLDGRHRLRAARDAGLSEVPVIEADLKGDTPAGYVVKAAVLRRHLSDDQRALMAALYAKAHPQPTGAAGHRKSDPRGIGLGLAGDRPGLAAAAQAHGVSTSRALRAGQLLAANRDLAMRVHSGDLGLSEARRLADQCADRDRLREVPPPPAGQYRTIVIDPPWEYPAGDLRGGAPYASMTLEKIRALPVGSLAADAAHLWLWITNRHVFDGKALVESWGFRYVDLVTWCKVNRDGSPAQGLGLHYFRTNTEQVIFAVRGSWPITPRDVGTWFTAPRGPDGHSSKPDEFYQLVERCSPGPYVDLFARRRREGWQVWGNLGDGATAA